MEIEGAGACAPWPPVMRSRGWWCPNDASQQRPVGLIWTQHFSNPECTSARFVTPDAMSGRGGHEEPPPRGQADPEHQIQIRNPIESHLSRPHHVSRQAMPWMSPRRSVARRPERRRDGQRGGCQRGQRCRRRRGRVAELTATCFCRLPRRFATMILPKRPPRRSCSDRRPIHGPSADSWAGVAVGEDGGGVVVGELAGGPVVRHTAAPRLAARSEVFMLAGVAVGRLLW